MEVFFDTEFTTLGDRINLPHLISIGCVAQGGEEFYAELTDTWQQSACSEFVVENVLPLLQGGDSRMKESELAVRLKGWIEGLTTNEEVVFCTDSPRFDWPFVGELFNFYGWPKNMRRRYSTVFFEEGWRNQYYDAGLQDFWNKNLARQHHSLVDARSMQCAWKFAMQQSQPSTTCEDSNN